MEVFRGLNNIPESEHCYLTIGSFDGLHRGHQELVKKVVAYAQAQDSKSMVITFDPHPRHVLNSREEPLPLIMSIDKKLDLLEQLSVDYVIVIPFTKEFSQITAKDFLDIIILHRINPRKVVVGYDHHFGYNREGSPRFTKEYLVPHGVEVEIVDSFRDEDVIISSTHIRELINAGNMRRASFELGWVYGFEATVVHGAGRGRTLNFPTANFIPVETNQLLPGNGVYLARGRLSTKNIYGMCNLGLRPTFDNEGFVMEVHFFNEIEEELYGHQIMVEFLERIRDERKFDSSQALIKQLEKDRQHCFELLAKYK